MGSTLMRSKDENSARSSSSSSLSFSVTFSAMPLITKLRMCPWQWPMKTCKVGKEGMWVSSTGHGP